MLQSEAKSRILAQTTGPEVQDGTVAVRQPSAPFSPVAVPTAPVTSKWRLFPLWIGAPVAVAAMALLAGEGFAEAGGSSRWVDNWGAEYQVTLSSDGYNFTSSGTACRGPYTSQGTGVIKGERVEARYRSSFSVGTCIGTISGDGNRIIYDCRDSVCGAFRTTIDRR